MSDTSELAEERERFQWRGRRVAAMVLRVVVFFCPLSVAVVVGLVVSRCMPGHSVGAVVIRFVMTAAVSVCAFMVVERLARRFLPLAALLRLNLVFPDRAPSRFSVALRSTSVRKLQQWVREARASDDVAVLAGKVVTLASALNTHDRRTRGHCERTRALAELIVEELHMAPAEANNVRWGAFLHDIGKLVVPTEILNKPGKPTTREWEVLKSHPEAGAKLVEPLRSFLRSGVDAVGCHHENYDGTGYPNGLRGEELPLAARIVSVADAFEVMTAVRAYKRPMTLQAARAELARRSGSQFDPQVVRAFLNVSLGRVHWTLGMAAWIAELPFLTILPRVAAQVSASAGGAGALAPAALPGIAAASLGAISVIGHVHPPATGPAPTSARVSPSASASPRARASASSGAATPGSSGRSTSPTASAPPTANVLRSGQAVAVAPVAKTSSTVIDGARNDVASGPVIGGGAGGDVGAAPAGVSPLPEVTGAVGSATAAVSPVLAVGGALAGVTESTGTTVDAVENLLGGSSLLGDVLGEGKAAGTTTTLP